MQEYSNQAVKAKRLRALDDGRGNPETLVYDDLGTQINTMVDFGNKVFHKDLPKIEKEMPIPVAIPEKPPEELPEIFDDMAVLPERPVSFRNRVRRIFGR